MPRESSCPEWQLLPEWFSEMQHDDNPTLNGCYWLLFGLAAIIYGVVDVANGIIGGYVPIAFGVCFLIFSCVIQHRKSKSQEQEQEQEREREREGEREREQGRTRPLVVFALVVVGVLLAAGGIGVLFWLIQNNPSFLTSI